MFKTINGWTKEAMKQQIRARNNGSKAFDAHLNQCVLREGRVADGNACAVGCFIPDDKYNPEFEDWSLDFLNEPEISSLMPLNRYGLNMMQKFHDGIIGFKMNSDMRDALCEWIDQNVTD
jgi:hypothetical protein